MTMAGNLQQRDEAQQRIDAYLGRLRQRLRGLHDEDVREIVEELRSHIRDKAGSPPGGPMTAAEVDRALAALGSPEELASQYLTDDLLARAEVSRSPLRILESLFRLGQLKRGRFSSLAGFPLGIFPWSGFHSRGRVEIVSSADRRSVAPSEWRRRF